MKRIAALAALGAALCACSATKYYYASSARTPLTPEGVLGATFAVPAGQARSTVRIVPLGLKREKGKLRLPVRYYLENNGTAPWRLDPTRQRVRLATGEALVPDAPETFEEKLTEVPVGKVRTWELRYSLPGAVSAQSDVKTLELDWEIGWGIGATEPVTGSTAFALAPLPSEEFLTNSGSGKKRGRH